MRNLIVLFALLALSPIALAQSASPSYDPVILSASFVALAAFTLAATQFAKLHLLVGVLEKLDPQRAKWLVIGLSFAIAETVALLLQFAYGGVTDPLFGSIADPLLRALTFGAVSALSASGFHDWANGIAQAIGKVLTSAKPTSLPTGIIKIEGEITKDKLAEIQAAIKAKSAT